MPEKEKLAFRCLLIGRGNGILFPPLANSADCSYSFDQMLICAPPCFKNEFWIVLDEFWID